MNNKDEPFELISDKEALEISKKAKEKKPFKLFSIKTLIILVVIFSVLTVSDYLLGIKNEKYTMVQELHNMFPALSDESVEKYIRKAADHNLTDQEFITWAGELAAKGEIFLSDSQKEEMAFLWWKAVRELPEDQQKFILSAAIIMNLGQQLTFEEDELVSRYVVKGLNLLNQQDRDKYYYLRSMALEEALKRE